MHHILVIIFFSIVTNLNAQDIGKWGLSIQPSLSKAKVPRGVEAVYAGAPNFSGDLKVTEENVLGISANVLYERSTRLKNFSTQSTIGFSSIGAFQKFDYDYDNSINNIKSIEKRYHYITLEFLLKHSHPFRKIQSFASIGPHMGYIVRSIETLKHHLPGGIENRSYSNHLKDEKPLNFGHKIEVGARYGNLSLSLFYKSYWYKHYNHQGKRVVNTGLSFSYFFKSIKSNRHVRA